MNLRGPLFVLRELKILLCEHGNHRSIPTEFGRLSLIELNFDSNQLLDVPSQVLMISTLFWLQLRNNTLTSLPSQVGLQLRSLGLGVNSFEIFPTSVLRCTALEYLDLHRNPLVWVPDLRPLKSLRRLLLHCTSLKPGNEILLNAGVEVHASGSMCEAWANAAVRCRTC
eukprot:TRINITY_DN9174_c0_g1_i1.p1 TRINITY_DN9174_c0_g1~~TRINITY_DN9174_c0_g1_i1.p1  ORF type:complete len:169 (+),score=4.68 TRINITY_DN9174_c0_g1_i1:231-737(+)